MLEAYEKIRVPLGDAGARALLDAIDCASATKADIVRLEGRIAALEKVLWFVVFEVTAAIFAAAIKFVF